MLRSVWHLQMSARVRPIFVAVLAATIMFLAAVTCGALLYFEAVQALKSEVKENLIRTARAAASVIDGDAHETIKSREQESSEAYKEGIDVLARLQRSDPRIVFVYTCVLVDEEVYFILDPTPPGDVNGDGIDEKAYIMDPYPEASQALIEALRTGKPTAEKEPYTDRWGTFMSGFAPLRNSRGELIGIVGVDITAEDYIARLASIGNSASAVVWVAFAVSCVIGILVFFIMRAAVRADVGRERSMKILSTQKAVLEMVAANSPLDVILHSICKMAESGAPDSKWMIVVFGTGAPAIYTGSLDSSCVDGLSALSKFNRTPNGIEPGYDTAYYEVLSRTHQAIATVCVCYPHRKRSTSEISELGHAVSQLAAIAIERRLIDQELAEARDKALEAARLKATFLATMSHEIRTPMNAIIGMTDLLLATGLKRNQQTFAETIRDSGQALLTLIDDILTFSKLESQSAIKEDIEFDLRELCETVCRLLAPTAQAKGLALVCSLPPVIPYKCRSDPHKIQQVLINLIGNAIKFTEAGSVVLSVTLRPMCNSKSFVRFSVSDTGIGIPPDRIDAIFETFVQGDASTTRKYGGTGLGLAICKQIVTLLGGQILVSSEVGVGTEFIVELEMSHGTETKEGKYAKNGIRGKVLVMEENAALRGAVCNVVRGLGFETTDTSSPEEASTLLSQARLQPYFAFFACQQLVKRLRKRVVQNAMAQGTRIVIMQALASSVKVSQHNVKIQYVNKAITRNEFVEALIGTTKVSRTTQGAHEDKANFSLHVLVVDDNPTNRRVAMHLLKRLGHTADFAENGKQALEMISANKYNVALMDLEMPEMDGVEAISRVRQLEVAWSSMPIIALTAHGAESEPARAAMEAGATGIMDKPVTLNRLGEVLEAFSRQRRPDRAA